MSDYISLVIAYRNHELIAAVLGQLAAQTQLPKRVLVVDNGGTLTDEDLAPMPLADRVTLISRPDNPGYGAAVNEARSHLGSDALLVLTHDAVFEEDLAASLLSALDADTRAGCAAPLLHFASDRERVFSAGGRLSPGGRAYPLLQPLSRKPYRVDWVDGAIAMYTAEALEAINWLDEDYFLYFEDVDSGWRLAKAGYSSLVVPSELACQEPGGHPMRLGVRNMTLFAQKAGIPLHRHLPALVYRVARESVGRLRRGRSPELAAIWQGWREGRAGVTGKPS